MLPAEVGVVDVAQLVPETQAVLGRESGDLEPNDRVSATWTLNVNQADHEELGFRVLVLSID